MIYILNISIYFRVIIYLLVKEFNLFLCNCLFGNFVLYCLLCNFYDLFFLVDN